MSNEYIAAESNLHMKTKWLVFVLLIIGGAISFTLWNRQSGQPVPAPVARQETPVAPKPQPETPISVAVEPPAPEPVKKAQVQLALKPKQTPKAQAQTQPANPGKEPLHDPEARDALALVGMDSEAEQYWLDAIFDSSLPDNEREDLMEDLNETGFADPKNLTADDLPLIMNRLEIIAEVLPSADDFMTDHLLEAQKDLVNMYARVAPQ